MRMGHQARQAHQEDVPTPRIDTQNVLLCRAQGVRRDDRKGRCVYCDHSVVEDPRELIDAELTDRERFVLNRGLVEPAASENDAGEFVLKAS